MDRLNIYLTSPANLLSQTEVICVRFETMHHFLRSRHTLLFILTCAFCTNATAQYGNFGWSEHPADTAAVDDVIYYGEHNDMSGGYNVGDTVFNFTAYDFGGNPVELYEELAGPKPVVLVSGSVSCIRFRKTWDTTIVAPEVASARIFMIENDENFNWIFIYGVEAHPTDGECPSNCPPIITNDTAVVQPSIYAERRWSMHTWLSATDHYMPFNMYADNPDNAVYNAFFQRPYGLVALNCDGTVGMRVNWVDSYFEDPNNQAEMLQFSANYQACQIDWQPDDEGDGTSDDGDESDVYVGPVSGFNSDNSNEATSSIPQVGIDDFKAYPNPANSVLTIETQLADITWHLTDMQGRSVASWIQNQFQLTVAVDDVPRGQYVLVGYREEAPAEHKLIVLQ